MGRYCDTKGCKTRASYGFVGKGVQKCKKDKLEGMVDLISKKCIHVKDGKRCAKQPNYNYPDKKVGLYCNDDKLPGMIDVKSKKCDFEENGERCIKHPIFNFPEKVGARRCEEHIIEGMIDKKHPCCIYIDEETDKRCFKRALYNNENDKSPLYCSEHKNEDMIIISDKKCEKCNKQPHFNFPGIIGGRFCGEHKLQGMIDVKNKKCEKCDLQASFGPLFGSKKHCYSHKLANEFRNNKPICEIRECCERAFYTNDGTNYPRRCEKHVLIDDVNIVEKPCLKCGLSFFLNNKTGLCDYCNDFFIKKIHKQKETKVIIFLKEHGLVFKSVDKIPEHGCSKYRPDAVLDFGYFIVILEIDEHQHHSYSDRCEIIRMIQLQQDYGGVPIVFVRYNPDDYEVKNGGNGEKKEVIKPNDSFRLKELYKTLKGFEIIRDNYEKKEYAFPPLSVIYLFYDNYLQPELKKIDIHEEIKKT